MKFAVYVLESCATAATVPSTVTSSEAEVKAAFVLPEILHHH